MGYYAHVLLLVFFACSSDTFIMLRYFRASPTPTRSTLLNAHLTSQGICDNLQKQASHRVLWRSSVGQMCYVPRDDFYQHSSGHGPSCTPADRRLGVVWVHDGSASQVGSEFGWYCIRYVFVHICSMRRNSLLTENTCRVVCVHCHYLVHFS